MNHYPMNQISWCTRKITTVPIKSLRPSDAYVRASKLPITASDNGLSFGRRQAIIWTNAATLLIRTLGTNFSEIHTF